MAAYDYFIAFHQTWRYWPSKIAPETGSLRSSCREWHTKKCQSSKARLDFVYPLVISNGKSPFLMGKSTISMAIFNSYVSLPEGKSNREKMVVSKRVFRIFQRSRLWNFHTPPSIAVAIFALRVDLWRPVSGSFHKKKDTMVTKWRVSSMFLVSLPQLRDVGYSLVHWIPRCWSVGTFTLWLVNVYIAIENRWPIYSWFTY